MTEDAEFTGSFTVNAQAFEQVSFRLPGNMIIAEYIPATGVVTFDWPAIEAEAVRTDGWCRGIARILLAARAAGRELPQVPSANE
jgi:hypothetical protein